MSHSRVEIEVIKRVNAKLMEKGCKIASIISACEDVDLNRDGKYYEIVRQANTTRVNYSRVGKVS